MTNQIRYMETKLVDQEQPVVWAFTEESVLEKDVKDYYLVQEFESIEKREVRIEEVCRTKYWNGVGFQNWKDNESGSWSTYYLGSYKDA